jgi:hypothetical protein
MRVAEVVSGPVRFASGQISGPAKTHSEKNAFSVFSVSIERSQLALSEIRKVTCSMIRALTGLIDNRVRGHWSQEACDRLFLETLLRTFAQELCRRSRLGIVSSLQGKKKSCGCGIPQCLSIPSSSSASIIWTMSRATKALLRKLPGSFCAS